MTRQGGEIFKPGASVTLLKAHSCARFEEILRNRPENAFYTN